MDEWYLIRSDDHDMDKDIVITAEIMDAVMDMTSVMVTCRISVQDPMKNLDNDREYMGQSNMSKENIINLISFNQYCQAQALSGFL